MTVPIQKTILSPHYHSGRAASIMYIVLHETVTEEKANGAVAVATYFKNTTRSASTHIIADNTTLVRCVLDTNTAFGCPGVNASGLHIEHVGMGNQSSADWADAYSVAELENSAWQAAHWSKEFLIPLKTLTDTELQNGMLKGVITHAQASRVFKLSDHVDPRNFPMASWLTEANKILKTLTVPIPRPKPTPPTVFVPPYPGYPLRYGSAGRYVMQFQRKLQDRGWTITVDGKFGPHTLAVVKEFQRRKGLVPDGIVGPLTWRRIWVAK